MVKNACDVKGCPIELGEKSGFVVKSSAWVLDLSDRDADSIEIERHACSHHLVALLKQETGAELAFAERFTPEGKKKRR